MKSLFFVLIIVIYSSFHVLSQDEWKWTQISDLPIATTSNSVCEAILTNEKFVYSFGGISDTFSYTNIHKRVFKYTVKTDSWQDISEIPDTLGKIGFRSSFVNNKIYLIGGKYMLDDSTAISANTTHVYNPFIDTFSVNGSSSPIPIYDHVQAVWKDSLIFTISGQNEIGTTAVVQIYNPYYDSWSIADSVPETSQFKTFGASGYILGDTIYYYGGIKSQFPQVSSYLRKGIINPENPEEIEWLINNPNPGYPSFKGACSGHDKTLFWVGGSEIGYTFNPQSDSINLIVPNQQITEYKVNNNFKIDITPYSIMDFNGIAKMGGGNWIIAGGTDSLQQISNRTFLLHNPSLSGLEDAQNPPYFQVAETAENFIILTENVGTIKVYNISGQILYKANKHLADLKIPKMYLRNGILLFAYEDNINLPVVLKKILTD